MVVIAVETILIYPAGSRTIGAPDAGWRFGGEVSSDACDVIVGERNGSEKEKRIVLARRKEGQ
ncbi:hypothetical protein WAI453_007929 [Rhynchosporium graminicola]